MKRADITAIFPEATKEQIDRLLDLNGSDISKAKGELDTAKTELEAANARVAELEKAGGDLQAEKERAAALETELNGLKAANELRGIREAVSRETGIPIDLLTADTEEACKAQAQGIMDYAKSGSFPMVKDGGEAVPAPVSGVDAAWQTMVAQIGQPA